MNSVYRGPFDIRPDPPSVQSHSNAVFMPRTTHGSPQDDPGWGLYGPDGVLIDAAAYRRGFGRTLIGQSQAMSFDKLEIESAPQHFRYLYGGHLFAHFGHFLLGVVPRLWMGLQLDLSDYKIVCHGRGTPKSWFSNRYIADLLASVGVKEDSIVNFSRPTRIASIVVPQSCYEEEHFACSLFAHWGNKIGQSLLAEYPRSGHSEPVFLAKTDVKHVVHGAVNEGELIVALEREGVEIIHPQKLSIASQAAIWRDRAYVFGSAGSALHSSILWQPGAQIVACSWQPNVHTNCGIIDVVNKNRITYTFPQTEPLGRLKTQDQNLQHAFRLNNPIAAAHEMLRAAGL